MKKTEFETTGTDGSVEIPGKITEYLQYFKDEKSINGTETPDRFKRLYKEIKELEGRPADLLNLTTNAIKLLKSKFNNREIAYEGPEIVKLIIRKLYLGEVKKLLLENKLLDDRSNKLIKEIGYRTRDFEKFPTLKEQMKVFIESEVKNIMSNEKGTYLTFQISSEYNLADIEESQRGDFEKDADDRIDEEIRNRNMEKIIQKYGKEEDLPIYRSMQSGMKPGEIAKEMKIKTRVVYDSNERTQKIFKKYKRLIT